MFRAHKYFSGNLFEDIGVDFMNLRDLGLDIEMVKKT
jgi:hypothetical protein